MPVALDSTAFNAPERMREKNFLRPAGPPVANAMDETAKEAVARSLLKQLTEAMCRLMLGKGADQAAPTPGSPPGTTERDTAAPKLKIFLSHAKTDGTVPARRIRDYIYSQTQLAAFYDENDIPFGSVFRRVLERDVQGEETAALVVVRSARYSSRPWCRRELSQWINCCRIVRVTQKDAGIADADIVPDSEAKNGSDRALFNAAVTLRAMRRLMMTGMVIVIPDAGLESVPAAVARVLLGGKLNRYRGFLPGIFEEALLTLEHQRPLYLY